MTAPRRHPPAQKALSLVLWPQADREAWLSAQAGAGPLDDGGLASHLSPGTRTDLTRRYAYFLSFLADRGELNLDALPAALVTPQSIIAYADFLEARASSVTLARSIYKVARVARCLDPRRDWDWLQRIVRRLDIRARPRNKRPDVVEITELQALGLELMEQAEVAQKLTPLARARLHRDGLTIALLATDPLRLKNIRQLEIGRNILKQGGTWSLDLGWEETKNRQPHIAILPDWIAPHIDRHIERYRPIFAQADTTRRLWLSTQGGPLSEGRFAQAVTTRTEAAFGKPITPHLFRDCLATSTALHHGAHMGLAMTVLGHQNLRVTGQYYNQAEMIGAVRAYQDMLLENESEEVEA